MNLVNLEQPPKDKEFTKFCNSLRCPLCGSQLDGNIHPKLAKLYCISNNDEYSCQWEPNQSDPNSEIIKYTYPQYQYVIIYDYVWQSGINETIINRYNMDVIPIYRNSTCKEIFRYPGRMSFYRKRMEEDKFLDKLRLYKVFS